MRSRRMPRSVPPIRPRPRLGPLPFVALIGCLAACGPGDEAPAPDRPPGEAPRALSSNECEGWGENENYVTIYSDSNFQGARQILRVGSHPASDFGPVGDNAVSSLKVPPGLRASVCSRDREHCYHFVGRVASLPAGIDNGASYIEVRRAVTVFRDAEFRGQCQTIRPFVREDEFDEEGLDLAVSSARVPPGLLLRLCTSDHSVCRDYDRDIDQLGDDMNDRAHLRQVKLGVTGFHQRDYQGWRFTYQEGTLNIAEQANLRSVRVGDGVNNGDSDRVVDGVLCTEHEARRCHVFSNDDPAMDDVIFPTRRVVVAEHESNGLAGTEHKWDLNVTGGLLPRMAAPVESQDYRDGGMVMGRIATEGGQTRYYLDWYVSGQTPAHSLQLPRKPVGVAPYPALDERQAHWLVLFENGDAAEYRAADWVRLEQRGYYPRAVDGPAILRVCDVALRPGVHREQALISAIVPGEAGAPARGALFAAHVEDENGTLSYHPGPILSLAGTALPAECMPVTANARSGIFYVSVSHGEEDGRLATLAGIDDPSPQVYDLFGKAVDLLAKDGGVVIALDQRVLRPAQPPLPPLALSPRVIYQRLGKLNGDVVSVTGVSSIVMTWGDLYNLHRSSAATDLDVELLSLR